MRRGLRLVALLAVAVVSAAFVLAAAVPAGIGCSGRPSGSVWCTPL